MAQKSVLIKLKSRPKFLEIFQADLLQFAGDSAMTDWYYSCYRCTDITVVNTSKTECLVLYNYVKILQLLLLKW